MIKHALPSAIIALAASSCCHAQLRVANWNVTTYSSGRQAEFRTALFGVAPSGEQFAPDILITQEMLNQTNFRTVLNGHPGGPTDYAAAINGVTTENSLFYRTSKVSPIGLTLSLSAGNGTCDTCPPRSNQRYLVRLAGYNAPATAGTGPELYLYSSHMKAGSSSVDQARRLTEATRLRTDTNALPAGAQFILGGDFNTQSSSQAAYQTLIGGSVIGRFFDPIASPGSWNNNCTFKWVFTQDQATGSSGGIDDRLDFLLISDALKNGSGFDYIGLTTKNYNTWCAANNTWDDPDHSYRSWGNDGFICNADMRTVGNSMVGTAIAQALALSALTTGHLPVYFDLKLPPRVTLPVIVNLGDVAAGSVTASSVVVTNNADVRLFAKQPLTNAARAFDALNYSFTTVPPSVVIAGGNGPHALQVVNQAALPAPAVLATRTHDLTFTAPQSTGPVAVTLTLLNNSDRPSLTIQLLANVVTVSCSIADLVGGDGNPPADGSVDGNDFTAFLNAFAASDALGDIVGGDGNPPADGSVDGNDFTAFLNAFAVAC